MERMGINDKLCDVPGCNVKAFCRGHCHKHYQKLVAISKGKPIIECHYPGCDSIYGGNDLMCPLHVGYRLKCSGEGCSEDSIGRGLCRLHYHRWRASDKANSDTPCSVESCDRIHYAKGMCTHHYGRHNKYGLSAHRLNEFDKHPYCEICGADGEAIDHCHETGVVRGLLCHRCNTSLGIMMDDPERLRRAADYLEGSLSMGA